MIETWFLVTFFASGGFVMSERPNEMRCDSDRIALLRHAAASELRGTCPEIVAASCLPGFKDTDVEGGE